MKKTYKDKIIDFGDYLRKKVDKKDNEELGELPTIEVNDENMYDMYTLLDHFFAQQQKKLTK